MSEKSRVTIYSDGSSRGNPGPGGYGTILRFVDSSGKVYEREYSAGYENTTNNRMELLGAIVGMEALTRPCKVTVVSDSQYLTDAFNRKWISSWIKHNWIKSDKTPVKNTDLWQRLLKAMDGHEVEYSWVRGHQGHPENERCDYLATSAADGDELLKDENYQG